MESSPESPGGKLHPFVQLSALSEAICATEPRLVLPHPVTLRLRAGGILLPGLGSDRFQITCATSGMNYFRCQEKFSLSEKKILWDVAGTPVLNLRRCRPMSLLLSPRPTWAAFAGEKAGKCLFKLDVKKDLLGNGRVTADFPDVCTGRMHHIVLKWNGWKDMAVIYSGEPEQVGISRIAKLYRSPYSRSHYLDISPEVDIALINSMCIAAIEK